MEVPQNQETLGGSNCYLNLKWWENTFCLYDVEMQKNILKNTALFYQIKCKFNQYYLCFIIPSCYKTGKNTRIGVPVTSAIRLIFQTLHSMRGKKEFLMDLLKNQGLKEPKHLNFLFKMTNKGNNYLCSTGSNTINLK